MPRRNKVSSAPMADRSWEARDALSTLTRADAIRKDRVLMKAVKSEARNQIKTVSRVLPTRKK